MTQLRDFGANWQHCETCRGSRTLARLALHPHNVTMDDRAQPEATFEPIEAKNGEWYVRLSLPGGRQPIVEGFKSEAEARKWIETDSIAWIEKYEGGKYALKPVDDRAS